MIIGATYRNKVCLRLTPFHLFRHVAAEQVAMTFALRMPQAAITAAAPGVHVTFSCCGHAVYASSTDGNHTFVVEEGGGDAGWGVVTVLAAQPQLALVPIPPRVHLPFLRHCQSVAVMLPDATACLHHSSLLRESHQLWSKDIFLILLSQPQSSILSLPASVHLSIFGDKR